MRFLETSLLRPASEPGPSWRIVALVAVSNLIFLLTLGMLVQFNRLAADDFCLLDAIRQHGTPGSVLFWWNTWSGRWAFCSLGSLLVRFAAADGRPWLYSLLTILLMVTSVGSLLRRLFQRFLGVRLRLAATLNLTLFVLTIAFFASFSRGEAWFWLSGCYYLWSFCLLCMASSLLLKEPPSRRDCVLACVLIAVVPGLVETMSALIVGSLFLLLVAALYRYRFAFRAAWNEPGFRLIFWPFVVCLLSFAFTLTSPGNWERIKVGGGSPTHAALVSTGYVLRIWRAYFSVQGRWLLVALLAGILIGASYPNPRFRMTVPRLLLCTALSLLAASTVIYITILPVVIAYQNFYQPPNPYLPEMVPPRALLFSGLAIVGFCIVTGFYLAQNDLFAGIPSVMKEIVIAAGVGGSLYLMVPDARNEYAVQQYYTMHFDARYALLLSLRDDPKIKEVILRPLPSSGWFYSAEINPVMDEIDSSTAYTNWCLMGALRLPFHVRLATQEEESALPEQEFGREVRAGGL